jgi:hypothetical protein
MNTTSPTLKKLIGTKDEKDLPKEEIICTRCPHGQWYRTPKEISCYCKNFFVITWKTSDKGEIIDCDGAVVAE